jgi:hypothetical protein
VSEGAPEQHRANQGNAHHHEVKDEHDAFAYTRAEQSACQLSWAATTIGMVFHSLLGGVALAAAVAAGAGGEGRLVGLGTTLVIILHIPLHCLRGSAAGTPVPLARPP